MNAVWSFWSKPFLKSQKSMWCSEKQHLLSWILSVQQARKFFGKTVLFTDDYGAKMLVDGLQLDFDVVSTALNTLNDHDPKWWALGKIYTYGSQNDPFIHIDNDVFLWKRLPVNSGIALFAQNPEYFKVGASFYMPEQIESLIKIQCGWLPKEWVWFRSSGLQQRAESCGVFGGGNTEFINYYAKLALKTIEHSANSYLWTTLGEHVERNILVEQYLLSACIEYYKNNPGDSNQPLDIHYLFNSMDDAFDSGKAADAGYTHLIADTKKNKTLAKDLERRVQKDYPESFEKYLRYADSNMKKINPRHGF
jgi:hypothetical protein